MLNLLSKTKPWMVASLIAATSVFGQNNAPCPKPCAPKPAAKPCPQPCPPTQVCNQDPCCPAWPTPVLNAAYNYPARIQTRCPWDFYLDASFIYWQPIQDNMELAFANSTPSIDGAVTGINANIVNMDFKFKPGFKVGLGGDFSHDNWDLYLEYTWFHNTNNQSTNGPDGGNLMPMWGHPLRTSTILYSSISESWRLKMDIIDLTLGRWYYVGTNLTFRPSFGARADWIRQRASLDETRLADGDVDADVAAITAKSASWAIGPELGLDTNWNLGCGFRVYGNSEIDLAFTKYTRLRYNETHTSAVSTPIAVKQNRVYAIKPHLDLELGLGWGTYLDCNNWYMDFAAGYEFQVFFDQNMFRHFNSSTMAANSVSPNGNLYLQGLTAKFRLDF